MYFENKLVLYSIRADTGCSGNKCTLVVEEFVAGEFMRAAIGFTALLQFWEV
jgi:hypothetical protein